MLKFDNYLGEFMKKFILLAFALVSLSQSVRSEDMYFPPIGSENWETISPESLNWNTEKIDTLYKFLANKNSKAFIVLKGGRIVLEKYFDNFTMDSIWYWASAGKTLTSTLVGIAQEEGLLSINDKTSKYLGEGWTSCPKEKEDLITIRHQLTMTTGLDFEVDDVDCTDHECLLYKADAGTQWYYHNAAYTLLENVVENASGKSYNQYYFQKIRNKIGMNGAWFKTGYNNIYYSNPRSMARFGIMIANNGDWEKEVIIKDKNYLNDMITTSQDLNKSYGYLWWLNGKESSMIPGTTIVFKSMLMPDAPHDAYAALGKNGQILCIAPDKDLIIVRMGNEPDDQFFISTKFTNDIWKLLNEVIGNNSSISENKSNLKIAPNPASEYVEISLDRWSPPARWTPSAIKIYNTYGECVKNLSPSLSEGEGERIDISNLPVGLYFIQIGNYSEKFVVVR